MNIELVGTVEFPKYTGLRCLMMPYIQGDSRSVPAKYQTYAEIIDTVFHRKGDVGFLTIDESLAVAGTPHRGARAKYGRALHTEAGKIPSVGNSWGGTGWGGTGWGGKVAVTLDADVKVILANNLDGSCALWNANHQDTSLDGDIGYASDQYPYSDAVIMKSGEVHRIGIFTPHESLPVESTVERQFLRIVSSGVYGREPYFTENELITWN